MLVILKQLLQWIVWPSFNVIHFFFNSIQDSVMGLLFKPITLNLSRPTPNVLVSSFYIFYSHHCWTQSCYLFFECLNFFEFSPVEVKGLVSACAWNCDSMKLKMATFLQHFQGRTKTLTPTYVNMNHFSSIYWWRSASKLFCAYTGAALLASHNLHTLLLLFLGSGCKFHIKMNL